MGSCVICEKCAKSGDWFTEFGWVNENGTLLCPDCSRSTKSIPDNGKKNLILISRGPNGIKTVREPNANWDWVEFHWAPDKTQEFRDGPDLVINETARNLKHYSVVAKYAKTLQLHKYERIGVVDDDVKPLTSWSNLFYAFDYFQKNIDTQIVQGAHAPESFGAHEHLKQYNSSIAREVTFIDDICAFFTTETFERVLATSSRKHLDFAIDRIWSSWKLPMLVLDVAPIQNTQEQGIHYNKTVAEQHVRQFLWEHGLKDGSIPRLATHSWEFGVPENGELSLDWRGGKLVRRSWKMPPKVVTSKVQAPKVDVKPVKVALSTKKRPVQRSRVFGKR